LLTNDLVGDGAIDDANDIPQRRGHVLLLIVQVHNNMVGGGPDVVVDALVAQARVTGPVLVEVVGLGAVAVQGLEDRQCILIRDGDGRDAGNRRMHRLAG